MAGEDSNRLETERFLLTQVSRRERGEAQGEEEGRGEVEEEGEQDIRRYIETEGQRAMGIVSL